jgi:hypothetical protein
VSTSGKQIPPQLLRNGRSEDQSFLATEELYRRCRDWPLNEQKSGIAFQFPDISVNRQKYCEDPCWTLLPNHEPLRVIAFKVGDIPSKLTAEHNSQVFEFRPVHKPEDENYSHSEVTTFVDGERFDGDPPKALRKKFRQLLAEQCWLAC